MTFAGRFGSAWHREGLPPDVRALALITLAGGLSALVASLFPASTHAPVELFRLVGLLALCCSLVLWRLGDRIPHWFLHATVAGGTLLISVLIARAATGVSTVVTATDYIWMGVYAAFFFSRGAARAHMALIGVGFGAALLVNDHQVPVDAWIFMTASIVVAAETIARQNARLRHEANTDSLTGLLNRKGLASAAERAFALADRTGIPVTVALVDLDHFKQVNDRDGHAAGDRLLTRLTRTWSGELEPSDIFARLGGDEFLVLLVGSDHEESTRTIERLRFTSPTPWSAGVVAREPGEDLGACLARADNRLYEVKRARKVQDRPFRSLSSVGPEAQAELGTAERQA